MPKVPNMPLKRSRGQGKGYGKIMPGNYLFDSKTEPRADHKAKMKIDEVLDAVQNINTDNELEEIEEELNRVKMIIDAEMQVTEDSEGSHENKYGKPVISEVRKSYLEK